MKARHITFFALLTLVTCIRADYIYDVDFEAPVHTVGTPVTLDGNANTPSLANGNVFVRSGLADLTTQVASLEPAGNMSFGVVPQYSTGVMVITWDMVMLNFGASNALRNAVFDIESNADGPYVYGTFNLDSTIEINFGQASAPFTLAEHNHFEAVFDLDSDLVDFFVDGIQYLDDHSIGATSPDAVVFGRDSTTNPYYAIDNFQWQIIPEPSTLFLLALGGCGLLLFQSRRAEKPTP